MSLPINKVLIVDGIHEECGQILRNAGIHVTEIAKPTTEQLLTSLECQDALLVRSATKVTEELIRSARGLKLVGRAGTGIDNIQLTAATERGILVMNTPGGNTLSAAEHTCTLLAALSKNLYSTCSALKHLQWKKKTGCELYGKVLAILGLGRIGTEVAFRMKAFGMKITGYDPMVSEERAAEMGVEKRELDDIWRDADFITVHTPLIPQTQGLINGVTLSRCKRGVRVVNVARGGIIDEPALLAALKSGQCGGAALDVFVGEPKPDPDLLQHPSVICTPHIGASTEEAQRRVALELADQIVDAKQTGALAGLMNATFLTGALNSGTGPWLRLAQCLGAVCRQLSPATRQKATVNIQLTGDVTKKMTGFVGQAVLLGLTSGVTTNGINLINAPQRAHQSGIVSKTSWQDRAEIAPSVISVRIESGDGEVLAQISGTVVHSVPTLLHLNRAQFDGGVGLRNNMIFLRTAHDKADPQSVLGWLVAQVPNLVSVSVGIAGSISTCSEEHPSPTTLIAQTLNPVQWTGQKPQLTESLFQIDFNELSTNLIA